MAEYIKRDTAIKAAEHAWNEWNLAMAAADGAREINLVYKRQELCKAVASVFDSAPAADVAPVVRCKDCEYYRCDIKDEFSSCYLGSLSGPAKNDFCCYGERKE